MTIFDKTLINLHKGYEKLKFIASIFSERVKVEMHIIRIRIKRENVQEGIRELYCVIGKKVFDLNAETGSIDREQLLLNHEEISVAMVEIVQRKKELKDLEEELKRERIILTPNEETSEETPL